ncbi:immune inhibitor A [Shimazuella sp. AN120528]|uniref:immune inhibitor A domain-containing protein n=1 Tax=Shimazuella soli TaxID=1892854 RepID=UPI001F1101A3|nr:immune inhibitor A domain-containing protein [Shimazuella soli]MCH5584782.1 immune inhibitor A [Shimazuella soli]
MFPNNNRNIFLLFLLLCCISLLFYFGQKVEAKEENQKDIFIDYGSIHQESYIAYLRKIGKITASATPEQIDKIIKNELYLKQNPFPFTNGIDTTSIFGKQVYSQQQRLLQKTIERVHHLSEQTTLPALAHQDNAVIALIEFPDQKHNQIKPTEKSSFWTKDFNPAHYRQLIFGVAGLKHNGKRLITANQYYKQQSAGSWSLAGDVTDWVVAKHDAAFYGAHHKTDEYDQNDVNPTELIKETLQSVAAKIKGKEKLYDQRDPYDLDDDGNVMEPDGLLDNLFVVHAGLGEEEGGGDNAIWSHRSVIGPKPVEIPGTTLKAYDYIIQPEDGATGVFTHEYAHNLGLPDEYDTGSTGTGSPVEAWSLMSYGSWTGKIPGTEPSGFSPWDKLFFASLYGGNWSVPKTIKLEDLKSPKTLALKEAVAPVKNGKMIKVDLPDKIVSPPLRPLGKKSYYSTKGNMLDTRLSSPTIDLTNKKSSSLNFDTWYDIEPGYDFLYVDVYVDGAKEPKQLASYTAKTGGNWVKKQLDLSSFVGHQIRIEFRYVTDVGAAQEGFYVDNIQVVADDKQMFMDDVEGEPLFTQEGFQIFDGSPIAYPNYYLIEWRTHHGLDQGLAHIRRNNSILSYDSGMLVWYYDASFGEDNQTGLHPGEGFLGVVDSHQMGHFWSDGKVGSTRYQINDAAFHFKPTSPMNILYPKVEMKYDSAPGVPYFSDKNDYSSPFNPPGGKILPKHNLTIKLEKVSDDERNAWITFSVQ